LEKINIDLAEVFPHLSSAPIVEGIIDIRSFSSEPFEEDPIKVKLVDNLENYSFAHSQREFRHEVKLHEGRPLQQTTEDLGFKGVRYHSEDSKRIVQFNHDGFVFSWLAPYPDWDTFSKEGLGLWKVFKNIANPSDINRIGLRFINRIELLKENLNLNDYTKPVLDSPAGIDLPFSGFMHHNTFSIPGHQYSINLIRTIQPLKSEQSKIGLIIDIDVFTNEESSISESNLQNILNEMRWIKNKAFFGSITDTTKDMLL